jgi:superoxide dismutase, Cu-Zn family
MKAVKHLTLAIALLFAPACDDEDSPASDAAVSGDSGTTTGDGGGATADGGAPAADVPAGETGASTGDGGASADAFTSSSGAWVIYDQPDGGANAAMGIQGSAAAYALDGNKTRVVLAVSGLTPSTAYGSHVHKLACSDMLAGGHYQDKSAAAADAAATDPMYGNVTNEIWLDFTTDAAGKGMAERTVDFRVRPGEAKAIVVHQMMTGVGGVAGPKLACLNIAF